MDNRKLELLANEMIGELRDMDYFDETAKDTKEWQDKFAELEKIVKKLDYDYLYLELGLLKDPFLLMDME